MSIFDVLRYPISNSPTKEELFALPHGLFLQWMNSVNFTHLGNDIEDECEAISRYYRDAERDGRHYVYERDTDIALLREMIKEHDESV